VRRETEAPLDVSRLGAGRDWSLSALSAAASLGIQCALVQTPTLRGQGLRILQGYSLVFARIECRHSVSYAKLLLTCILSAVELAAPATPTSPPTNTMPSARDLQSTALLHGKQIRNDCMIREIDINWLKT